MPDPMPTQSKEPSAWAMKAADDLAKHLRCDCDHCAFVAARVIDDAYAPLIDLVRQAVEAGAIDEVYLSLIRDALGQSTAGGSAKPDKQEGLEEAE